MHDERNAEEPLTETVRTAHSPEQAEAKPDVQSDPALDDKVGSDWTDEGGAAHEGPATAVDASETEGMADPEDPVYDDRLPGEQDPFLDYGAAGLPMLLGDDPEGHRPAV